MPAATVVGVGDRTPQELIFETVMTVVVLTFWKVMVTGAATAGAAIARLAITERTAITFIMMKSLIDIDYFRRSLGESFQRRLISN
jgi:hypothetical protein